MCRDVTIMGYYSHATRDVACFRVLYVMLHIITRSVFYIIDYITAALFSFSFSVVELIVHELYILSRLYTDK